MCDVQLNRIRYYFRHTLLPLICKHIGCVRGNNKRYLCHSILVLRPINNEDRMTQIALIESLRTHLLNIELPLLCRRRTIYFYRNILFSFLKRYLIKRNDFTHIFVNLLYKVHKIGLLLSVILLLFDCHVKIYERRGVANQLLDVRYYLIYVRRP